MEDLKGFYKNVACMQEDNEEWDFSFLENESFIDQKENTIYVGGLPLTMYDFLHGYCYLFALRLKNEFGYKISNILDEEGNLIHSYCENELGELIDIRGKTSNSKAFFEEFDDWLDSDNPYINQISHTIKDDLGKFTDEEKEVYKYTKNILKNYPLYYQP